MKPQSKTSSGTCASIDLEISNDLARKCKKMAVKMKCTPFMLFMSAYARHIQSISKKNDVAILTPAGNRKVLGNTNFVGNITFNLPIRIPDAIAARDLTKFKQLLGEVFDHYSATPKFLSDCLEATHIPAYAFEMNRRPVITLNKLECDLTTAFPLPYNAVAGLSLNESGATITAQWSYDSTSETEAEVKARHDKFIEILEEMTFVEEAVAA